MGWCGAGIIGIASVFLVTGPMLAQDTAVKVRGRVVDRDGKPVGGVEVASHWGVSEKDGTQTGSGGVRTDADGRFTIKIDFYGRDAALMAVDSHRGAGGTTVVPAAETKRECEIRIAPLVRLHGKLASKDLGTVPAWTNVFISLLPGKIRFVSNSSRQGEFSMLLPPGDYQMYAYGTDVKSIHKTLTLRANESDLDLGTVDLPATFLALHKGKEMPPWSVADARGVKKDVTLADYRGKWVLVDFWGHWCDPCVLQLGELIDFYEDHAADRDKFEILAFHDGTVKDFTEMDAKTERTKETLWHGRELPFPVLLDAQREAHGATIEAYEIQGFPTTILIDPEGKLVDVVSPDELAKKLTPIPPAQRIRRALDGDIALGLDPGPLASSLNALSELARMPIRLDEGAIKASGIKSDISMPLTLGGCISLRSWLELLLDPLGLQAVPGEECLMIVPAKRGGAAREPSESQKRCAARLEELLRKKASLDFKQATLEQVVGQLESMTDESFVLDPGGRLAGVIDPEAGVTGSTKDVPLRQALEEVLKPLGLIPVVKNEVVVLTKSTSH